jgi:hypothetical protein
MINKTIEKRYDLMTKLEVELQDARINYIVYDGPLCGELEFAFPDDSTNVIQTHKLDRAELCDLIADVLRYNYR